MAKRERERIARVQRPEGATVSGKPADAAGRPAREAAASKKAGPRAFRLDPDRLAAARRALGTPNDTATIDAALDYVVFGRELRAGAEALAGMAFDAFDGDAEA
jgi:hypothetical protein